MVEVGNILDIEKQINDLEAIIFDLDDTLYSEKQYVKSGYKKIAEYFGHSDMETEMWEVFESGGKAIDHVLRKYELLNMKDTALYIYRNQEPEITLYSGVLEMIQRIRKKKKVGIITDGRPEGQKAKLKALNIVVDNVIITDELGGIDFRKPNPKAFKLMLKKMNIQPTKACYIGDNIRKDFTAPKKLGMKCIWFNNPDGIYK